MQASLGCWTAIHLRGGFLYFSGLVFLSVPLLIAEKGAYQQWVVVGFGIGMAVLAYWWAVGLLNRWTVHATEDHLYSSYGPLPWIWWGRRVPTSTIVAFLPHAHHVTVGGLRHGGPHVAMSSYGIDVVNPGGRITPLVRGCGDAGEVARVRQTLDAFYGVGLPP